MKTYFERREYLKGCILGWLICTVMGVMISCFLFGVFVMFFFLAFSLVFGAFFIVFNYRRYSKVLEGIETVATQMDLVLSDEKTMIKDAYEEGSLGILYTNFEKLVRMLQEGKQREEAEKLFLKEIMSDISHQLKTPLASLRVFTDLLLQDSVKNPAEQKKILKESDAQLERMEWMVLSMLKLARIESKSITFEKKEVILRHILENALSAVEYLIQNRQQVAKIDCPEDIKIATDEGWLTEALINLIKNASDYTKEGGEIKVKAVQNELYIKIMIEDNGCGIPEKDLPHIFKRFYRVNSEVNPNSVGIGLSLTKSIVEGLDGSILVRSKVMEGTTFTILFK